MHTTGMVLPHLPPAVMFGSGNGNDGDIVGGGMMVETKDTWKDMGN